MLTIQTTLNNVSFLDLLKNCFGHIKSAHHLTLARGILSYALTACPLCNSPVCRDGYNIASNRHTTTAGTKIKKGKVRCTKQGCRFSLCVDKTITEQLLAPFTDLYESIMVSLRSRKCSAATIAGFLKDLFVPYSDEHIRKKVDELLAEHETPPPQHPPTGVIVHDEQFAKIKGAELMRISVLDAGNPNVYYDELEADRQAETISGVCKQIKGKVDNLFAIVIDGCGSARAAYRQAFPESSIQNCLFHYAMNVRGAYSDEVGYGKGRRSFPLEHLIGFFCIMNVFFDHEREIIELRELQKKLNEHLQRINRNPHYKAAEKEKFADDVAKKYAAKAATYLRKVKQARRRKQGIKLQLRTEEQAKSLLEKAKLENIFPKEVTKQIQRVEKKWEDFTHCMRDSRIPPTSNKAEQYYAATLNWVEKNNLQSEGEFYDLQKIGLMKRYGIPFVKEGVFSDFLERLLSLKLAFDSG